MRIKQLTTVQQSDGTTQVLPYVQKENIEDLMFKTLSEYSTGANQMTQTFPATSATATPTPSAIIAQPEVILMLDIETLAASRSEERRDGKRGVRTWRSRWWQL